jgi:hypothetical protein
MLPVLDQYLHHELLDKHRTSLALLTYATKLAWSTMIHNVAQYNSKHALTCTCTLQEPYHASGWGVPILQERASMCG